jgi:alkylated DNA repair dioxygenase AlkB
MDLFLSEFVEKVGEDKLVWLNDEHTSWAVYIREFLQPLDEVFDETWNSHPSEFHTIRMFDKDVKLPRWQQAYGTAYTYSGAEAAAIAPTPLVASMMEALNDLVDHRYKFNMCLCNWYAPEHYIGPHSDDTRQLVPYSPIAGISWGAARHFVLTSKKDPTKKNTFVLRDGDLLIMGGRCQETHKHEILKYKKSDEKGNRISFTFRCFH